tara:strand:- start:9167 stop:9436 length:270 start_codon:yes stop_codon:yes gene_type:complete
MQANDMTQTTETRNAVADMLNEAADMAGIDKTDPAARNNLRGLVVKTLVEGHGVAVEKAWDLIWGAGEYKKLVSDLYDTLNAELPKLKS